MFNFVSSSVHADHKNKRQKIYNLGILLQDLQNYEGMQEKLKRKFYYFSINSILTAMKKGQKFYIFCIINFPISGTADPKNPNIEI